MKRGAERQITKDDAEVDEEENENGEGGANAASGNGAWKAAPEVIAKRKIVKARRSLGSAPVALKAETAADNGAAEVPKSNPFGSLVQPTQATATVTAEPAARVVVANVSHRSSHENDVAFQKPAEDSPALQGSNLGKADALYINTEKTEPSGDAADTTEPNNASEKQSTQHEGSESNAKQTEALANASDGTSESPKDTVETAAQTAPVAVAGSAVAPAKSSLLASEQRPKHKPFTFGNSAGGGPGLTFADTAAANGGPEFSFKVPASLDTQRVQASNGARGSNSSNVEGQKFAQIEVKTGEEDETEEFRVRAKVYTLDKDEQKSSLKWKERGVGPLKLNVNKDTKRARLVMRTEATLRVTLNAPLFPEFKVERASERCVRFTSVTSQTGESGVSVPYLVKVATPDDANMLTGAINKWKVQV